MAAEMAANTNGHRVLIRIRRGWLVLAVCLFGVFLISIPGTYQMLLTPCAVDGAGCDSWAQPTPVSMAMLQQSGVSPTAAALYLTGLYAAVSLVFWAVGLLIYRNRSDQWFALLVAHLMVLLGTGGVSLVFTSGLEFTSVPLIVNIVVGLLTLSLYQFISIFFLTFPNGKFYGRWNVIPFILICLNTLAWLVAPPLNIQYWSGAASSAWLLLVFGSHLVVQVIRYRKMYTTAERQQTKWLIYGFSVPVLMFFGITALMGTNTVANGSIHPLVNGTLVVLLYLPIGLAIGIAILRYRLWDIDILINRTLVYALLTGILVGVYALIVSGLGALVKDIHSFAISLLSAGVIAVSFQPLRVTIQRTINRLMFGQRDEPMTVVSELGKGLDRMLSPETALAHLVETTATTLKLPYVAVERADTSQQVTYGRSSSGSERFPLIYHAQLIGELLVAPRSRGESLNAADRLVLENVARQASNVVVTARLAADLQESRQRIVTAREEERRRLRRDLHDGLGPALATLTLQAEAARDWLRLDPERSEALLGEIVTGTQTTLADIRRVVYALRPPALDDLGLLSAIKEQAVHCASPALSVSVDAPEVLPPLPAAVEVAVYRIVQEALTNVTRHAAAQTCQVCLHVNGKVEIEVTDDGKGIPTNRLAGVGLNSMHERAAELGGLCAIKSQPGKGTHIRVSLPYGEPIHG